MRRPPCATLRGCATWRSITTRWTAVAHAYLDQDKRAEAGALFAQIAKDQTAPESVRSRARQMAGVLGVDAIEDVEALLAEQGVERESAAGEDAAVATE